MQHCVAVDGNTIKSRDFEGWNPLQLALGRIVLVPPSIIDCLLDYEARLPLEERTVIIDNIVDLVVLYDRFETLRLLIQKTVYAHPIIKRSLSLADKTLGTFSIMNQQELYPILLRFIPVSNLEWFSLI